MIIPAVPVPGPSATHLYLNDSVATSVATASVATTSSLDLVAATFPKSDSPQLFFACSKSKGKLAFVS